MHPTLFALKRAYQAARHVLELELQGTGMTVAQMDVLKLLLESPAGLDQRVLQTSLGVTSATLARMLTGMETRKFIARTPHPTDARGKTVRLTAKATRLFESFTDSKETEYAARLLEGFSKEETKRLTEMLGRIADNMSPVD